MQGILNLLLPQLKKQENEKIWVKDYYRKCREFLNWKNKKMKRYGLKTIRETAGNFSIEKTRKWKDMG